MIRSACPADATGEAAVGKSSVVLRFVQNDFQENKEPTIGAAFLTVSVFLNPAYLSWLRKLADTQTASITPNLALRSKNAVSRTA